MATISYRTTDDKKDDLAEIANESGVSVNRLIDDAMTVLITERNSYRMFQARAERGNVNQAMSIIESKMKD